MSILDDWVKRLDALALRANLYGYGYVSPALPRTKIGGVAKCKHDGHRCSPMAGWDVCMECGGVRVLLKFGRLVELMIWSDWMEPRPSKKEKP